MKTKSNKLDEFSLTSEQIKAIYFKKNRFKFLNSKDDYVLVYKTSTFKTVVMYNPSERIIQEILRCCKSITPEEILLTYNFISPFFKEINNSLRKKEIQLFINCWSDIYNKKCFLRISKKNVLKNLSYFFDETEKKWFSISEKSSYKHLIELISNNH